MRVSKELIESIDDLNALFKAQVDRDNQQFGIESVYLPNPIFTKTPKYCLVAMEPSLGGMTVEAFRARVEQGFKNFLYYECDFILHYCAHNYLCRETYNYLITDISKGAMRVAVAGAQRR